MVHNRIPIGYTCICLNKMPNNEMRGRKDFLKSWIEKWEYCWGLCVQHAAKFLWKKPIKHKYSIMPSSLKGNTEVPTFLW